MNSSKVEFIDYQITITKLKGNTDNYEILQRLSKDFSSSDSLSCYFQILLFPGLPQTTS